MVVFIFHSLFSSALLLYAPQFAFNFHIENVSEIYSLRIKLHLFGGWGYKMFEIFISGDTGFNKNKQHSELLLTVIIVYKHVNFFRTNLGTVCI